MSSVLKQVPAPLAASPDVSIEDQIDEYALAGEMVRDLQRVQKNLRPAVESVLKKVIGETENVVVGRRTVSLAWAYPQDDNMFDDKLILWLMERGHAEAIRYIPAVDPRAIQDLLTRKIIQHEDIAPFLKPPTPRITVH